jgi:glycerol-3-phosphate dehydrogenase
MIPPHEFLNRERTISEDPNIPRANLMGSLLYYDYANINPERHTCDFIFSAKRRGGNSFNYVSVTNIEKNNEIFHITVVDSLTNRSMIIKSKTVVNSAGPWADSIDKIALKGNETHILRSKGIHIVTRNISQKHCSVRITKNKKHLFVIPWRGKTIIGTTDVSFNDNPDMFNVTRQDIQNLISEINEYLNFKIEDSDVDYYYGGMRPLVDDSTESKGSTYNLSRKTEITDHKDIGFSGYFTALGGKYTTSRNLAEKVVDKVCEVIGKGLTCSTNTTPLYSGNFSDLPTLIRDLKNRHSKLSDKKAYNLCSRYGSLAYEIAELGRDNSKNLSKPILNSQSEEYYPEEIDYISRLEDVVHLSDFYFRRSGIGNIGKPSSEMFRSINSIVGASFKREINKGETNDILQRYEF